jgi:AraC-like DNA-binding protein/quercetin dioxygenase-like cupin family protein
MPCRLGRRARGVLYARDIIAAVMPMAPDTASHIRTLALPGGTAEVFIAREPDRRFAMHWHDAWSVGTIEAGHCGFVCEGQRHLAEPGDVIVMAPGSVHAAGVSAERFAMTMLYLPPTWAAAACNWPPGRRPSEVRIVRHDAALGTALAGAARDGDAKALAHQAVQALQRAATGTLVPDPPAAPRDPRVQALADALAETDAERLDIGVLAQRLGLSREHLHRLFRGLVGLTPGEYSRCARMHAAKRLLREGASLAEAAQASGFADQAHFSRWFRRIFGVTPTMHAGCQRVGEPARSGDGALTGR